MDVATNNLTLLTTILCMDLFLWAKAEIGKKWEGFEQSALANHRTQVVLTWKVFLHKLKNSNIASLVEIA